MASKDNATDDGLLELAASGEPGQNNEVVLQAADMVAVYILLGCLALSGLVILGILVYCTSQCWRKRYHKMKHNTALRLEHDPGCRYSRMNGFSTLVHNGVDANRNSANTLDEYSTDKRRKSKDKLQTETRLCSGKFENYISEKSLLLSPEYDALNAPQSLLNGLNGVDTNVVHYDIGYDKTHMSCFRGTLTFALRYDYIHRVLMLHLIRATHLPAKDKTGSNPYVKMYLLPDRRNHCKTCIHRKTTNAEFNEMFSFAAGYGTLSSRMLQFTVYDFDRFSRHDLIGNVIMRDLFEKSDLYTWTEYTMHIIASNEKDDYGDLLLYLLYQPGDEKIIITVVKAYNLRPMDITGASDPYVKIFHILNMKRKIKMKKTSTKRANLNPVYNEAITLELSAGQVEQTNLLIKVMDWDRIGSDDLLGCAILGPASPTPEGKSQWEEAISHPGRAVGRWHSLLAEVPADFTNLTKAAPKAAPVYVRNEELAAVGVPDATPITRIAYEEILYMSCDI